MLAYLKALAARVGRPWLRFVPPPFEDPPIGVREPKRRGPGGRSSAVAVEEPGDGILVQARGSGGAAHKASR